MLPCGCLHSKMGSHKYPTECKLFCLGLDSQWLSFFYSATSRKKLMAIIISKNNQNARRIEESKFNLEDNLQEYVINNPEIIPIYDIDTDARLFVAAREFTTNSGPIDALGFDENGNIYIIETKLFKNSDKRTVVAQALDYGASMWRHATNFDEFISQLDSHTRKQFNLSFSEQYEKFFEIADSSSNLSAIKNNLSEGNIKFVVLMDSLDERLKDLIVYVNQNSKFDIYAVDFEYYKHDEFEIVIPKLYGTEVKKTVPVKTTSRKQWNEFEFFNVVNNDRNLVSDSQKEAVYKLWNWAKSHSAEFSWGTANIYGTFSPVFAGIFNRSFVTVSVDSYIRINYGHLDLHPQARILLRDILKKHLGDNLPKVTNLSDDELMHIFPSITAKEMPEYVDLVILAFDEFIKTVRNSNE